jgi:hypothetical protein
MKTRLSGRLDWFQLFANPARRSVVAALHREIDGDHGRAGVAVGESMFASF